ncbi:MAG TPA: DUF4349 domain-containing protein, partial [Gemmatimonadales bacterium]|nr:DUF4349 domain-containing protein [Gemmatimonadales bacterium]
MSATVIRCSLVVLLLAACGQKAATENDLASQATNESAPAPSLHREVMVDKALASGFVGADAAKPASQAPYRLGGGVAGIESAMIIRTGNASIEIDSLETAIAAARALATRVGGYVANTAIQSGRYQYRSAIIDLKLPADRFDTALEGLAPLGKVEGVNVSTEDVSEEFTDLTARASNAHRLEARLIELI